MKPVEANQLVISVANASRRRCLEIENRAYRTQLEQRVLHRNGQLRAALDELQATETQLRVAVEHSIDALAVVTQLTHSPSASR